MTIFEAIGLFYVILATTVFTIILGAGVVIALVTGGRILYRRYQRGQIEEDRDIVDQLELRRMVRTGR